MIRLLKRPLAFAALLVAAPLLAGSAAAQQVQGYGLKIDRVESGLYPYVNVYFRTFDQNQDPLTNLNALNIGLMVTGRAYDVAKRQYTIQPLRQRPEAVRTVLVLDASRSMWERPFKAALEAAARFIDHKRPQDQIAILAIRDTNDGYDLVSTWEREPGPLGRRLADVKCDGMKSRIYDTLAAAIRMTGMTAQESQLSSIRDYPVSNAIVIFSDGLDEGSALSREELNTRISTLQVFIPIYSVAYSNQSTRYFRNLEALSINSFGKYYPVGQAFDQMQRVVENIQNILLGDYVATFRAYVGVDGAQHAFRLGVEYPSGSGKYTYENSQFEAIEAPPMQPIIDHKRVLDGIIPALSDENPYMRGPTPVPVHAPGTGDRDARAPSTTGTMPVPVSASSSQ